MANAGGRQIPGGVGALGSTTGGIKDAGVSELHEVFAELGLERCSSCGSMMIEGSCVQCQAAAPAISGSIMGRQTGTICANCSTTVVTGASFCGHCGEAVHASTLSLARVRAMRARLESLR